MSLYYKDGIWSKCFVQLLDVLSLYTPFLVFPDITLFFIVLNARIIISTALLFLPFSTVIFALFFRSILLYNWQKIFRTADVSFATDSSLNRLQCSLFAVLAAFARGTVLCRSKSRLFPSKTIGGLFGIFSRMFLARCFALRSDSTSTIEYTIMNPSASDCANSFWKGKVENQNLGLSHPNDGIILQKLRNLIFHSMHDGTRPLATHCYPNSNGLNDYNH